MADKLISDLGAAAFALTDVLEHEPLAGAPSTKGDINALITLLNTVYGTGPFLPLAGGTMTGAILFNADNTIDIGASGATRPRTGYFGTSVVTALVASPAATALSFASAGTTRANFSTSGHLLFNLDNTYDIGATGATRPRVIYAGTRIETLEFRVATSASNGFNMNGRFAITGGASDGIITLTDYSTAATFVRLNFGPATSSFPALKRSTTTLQVRLADDSAFANVSVLNVLANNAASLITSSVALTDFAAAGLGTLGNAPSAGNPAKWIAIIDNGTTRYIPTWV